MASTVTEGLQYMREDLADFYRDLHSHPELSLQETRTAALLAQRLRDGGFGEVVEKVGVTGVVGVLRNGDGPVVMLRADFDALPVEEKTGLPYASTVRAVDGDGHEVPVMHACGHDMHAVCLTGAAALLARCREQWSGTLLVVFQPAETAVVTVGRLKAGTKDNIIPESAELGVNIRAFTPAVRDLVRSAVERIVTGESRTSGAPKPPDFTWFAFAPALVSEPEATKTTVAAFSEHFGAQRLLPMPQVNASEDVGVFGEALGVPTVFWFWGGLEAESTIAAFTEGRVDELPSNH
ncbi:M20/M25/M40 family metallo-hydrolase [Streptomyces sp. NBC_00656]|uniref:M20/M25/M40 family metallo-hydrolase n=1 Tax=Streptomyces sp. NBC_00656 TaxID=2903668 RepID=UPI00386AC47A